MTALAIASEEPAAESEDRLPGFAKWLRDRGMKRVTVRNRLIVVQAFLGDFPDFVGAGDEQIEDWMDRLALSRSTRSTYRTHLRSLFTWAAEVGLTSGTHLAPLGGPGSASSPTPYGRGRQLMAVSGTWAEPIGAWVSWLLAGSFPASTLYLREYQLRRFAVDRPGLSPWEVTPDDLSRWMSAREWSPETRRTYRSALRSFYGWAHATGRTLQNPAALLPAVRRPTRAPRPTPEALVSETLAAADDRARLMVLLAARTGLRRGEIAQAHTDDLVTTMTGPSLLVRGKGRRQRLVPLSGEVARALREVPPGWVFPGQVDGHLSPGHVGKLMSSVLGQGWTAHTLRHRFATVAYAAQRDVFAVQQLLGHASPETTQIYVQLPDDALRAAVEAAGGGPAGWGR